MKLQNLYLLLSGLLLLGACARGTALETLESSELPEAAAAAAALLPAPGAALRQLSFEDVDQFRFGREFEPGLPQRNVEVQGEQLQFWPQGRRLSDLALAVYSFNLAGYDEERALYLNWSQPPNGGSLRIALANWNSQRWDWFTPDSAELLKFGDLKDYVSPAGACLVALTLEGLQPGTLERLSFGLIADPLPAEILHIAPQGGSQGAKVRFSAKLAGTEPYSYAWDFGGAASPNTSTEDAPLVQLGTVGSYAARLTVTNRFSSDTYVFSLRILPQSNWVHTLGAKKRDSVRAACSDSAGNVYAALALEYGESCIAKFSTLGELLWLRRIDGAGPLYVNQIACAADGSLLLGAETYALNSPAGEEPRGGMVLHLSSEGEALGAYELDAFGGFCFAADGSALACDQDSGLLQRINSFSGNGWSAGLSSGAGMYLPRAARACLADDGSQWFACSIRGGNLVDDGPCIARLDAAGQVVWARYCPLQGDQIISGLCALPDGVLLVANSKKPYNAQADPRSGHLAAFGSGGQLLFKRYRESVGSSNPPVFLDGRIYVGGLERRERASGSAYYVALNAYSLQGAELGAWGLLSLPACFGLGLDLHADGSLLISGTANTSYVSIYEPSDAPLTGPTPDYLTLALNSDVQPYQAQPASFTTAQRGLTLDSGAGEDDGLLMKFDPQL